MKIVVNRSDAIGDLILTLPLLCEIKNKYPDSQIALIVSNRTAELVEGHPLIDKLFVLDKRTNFFKNFFQLRRFMKSFAPDVYLHVGGGQIPNLVALWLRVKVRTGLLSKWPNFFLLNKGIRQSRSIVIMHESEYNLNLLSAIGIEYRPVMQQNWKDKLLYLTNTEKLEAQNNLQEDLKGQGIDPTKPYVVIHPGMTGHTLNWSSRNYGRLIVRIYEEFPNYFNFIISYTPSDETYLFGLRDQLKQKEDLFENKCIYFYNGALRGLRQFNAVLSEASLYIGPSTGPSHMANIMNVPGVYLYSPIKVQSSTRWGPLFRNDLTRVVVPDVVCGEQFRCAGDVCPYFECMSKVEVDHVYSEAYHFLKQAHAKIEEELKL